MQLSQNAYRVVLLAWLVVGLYVLWSAYEVVSVAGLPEAYRTEQLMVLGLVVTVMSFPAGLLWWGLLVAADALFALELSQGQTFTIGLELGGALALGFLQWFVLIPAWIARRRKKCKRPATTVCTIRDL